MSYTPLVQAAKNVTSGNGMPNNSAPWDPCSQPSVSNIVHVVSPGAHNIMLLMFYIHILAPYNLFIEVVLTAEFGQQIMISIKPEGRL